MSQDELVDIVDENDVVINTVTKKEAHDKGLLHRCVVAEIKDSKGRWLLIKPSSHKQDASQYVSPVGGHVTASESTEEALKREVLEEVGLSSFEYKFIGKTIFNRFILGRQENHYFNLFEIYSDEELKTNDEIAEYTHFTDDELKHELKNNPRAFGDAFYIVLKNFYPHLL